MAWGELSPVLFQFQTLLSDPPLNVGHGDPVLCARREPDAGGRGEGERRIGIAKQAECARQDVEGCEHRAGRTKAGIGGEADLQLVGIGAVVVAEGNLERGEGVRGRGGEGVCLGVVETGSVQAVADEVALARVVAEARAEVAEHDARPRRRHRGE
jgi:hypothetical protein